MESSKYKPYLTEILTLLLYAGFLLLVMLYHEPWFDEAQAWMIAKDSCFITLIKSVTHYEGNPPIWFIALMPIAKSGVPFEIGIKTVNYVIQVSAMGILIFKAPFKRIIKCTIPFTYFFFYQYGVISRPYSLMVIGFVLLAIFYKNRYKKPYFFVFAMILICSSSAFGMVISAGITLSWLYDIFRGTEISYKFCEFIRSNIFISLLLLLAYNIILVFCIYPFPGTYGISVFGNDEKIVRMAYMFLIAPADALFTNSAVGVANSSINLNLFISIILSSLLNLIMIILTKQHKKLSLFLIPFTLFALFSTNIYFWNHHVGIITMFYLFTLWCCEEDKSNKVQFHKFIKCTGILLLGTAITISIYWTAAASVNDIKLNYGTGREAARFIKDNNLSELNIVAAWKTENNRYDYNFLLGVSMLPYFHNNIIANLNIQRNNAGYLSHQVDPLGRETVQLIKDSCPEILISTSDPNYTFGHLINMEDFILIKTIKGYNIWKDKILYNDLMIYIRKDILYKYPIAIN